MLLLLRLPLPGIPSAESSPRPALLGFQGPDILTGHTVCDVHGRFPSGESFILVGIALGFFAQMRRPSLVNRDHLISGLPELFVSG